LGKVKSEWNLNGEKLLTEFLKVSIPKGKYEKPPASLKKELKCFSIQKG
jgi:hypothetical protein